MKSARLYSGLCPIGAANEGCRQEMPSHFDRFRGFLKGWLANYCFIVKMWHAEKPGWMLSFNQGCLNIVGYVGVYNYVIILLTLSSFPSLKMYFPLHNFTGNTVFCIILMQVWKRL